ncbi:unnamed protein product [Camellia sinensis]
MASNCFGFFGSVREANRHLDWSKFIDRDRSLVCHGRLMNGKKQKCNYCSFNADFRYSCLVESGLERKGKFHVLSSLVTNPTGEMTLSSEQMVYEVVLKQAALVNKRHKTKENPTGEMTVSSEQMVYEVVLKQASLVKKRHKTKENYDVKPDVLLPGNLSLLSEAYDHCGEVCDEYAKTFYLGNAANDPQEAKSYMGNIRVWCRRTDKVVDGPNASHITPTRLDRWESRLEDLFRGCPFDMLDAALSDTVAKFPVDIQYARRGRVHLPQDELAEAGLSDEDIFAGKVTDKWRNFMKNKIKRAKMFFDEAEKGVTELSSSSRWP